MVMENKAFTRKVLMVCILLVCSTHAMYAQSFLKKLGKAVERELFLLPAVVTVEEMCLQPKSLLPIRK